ncbi:MAG TPA: amidohydrolase family protein [Thermoanaerobaculia bacterium]|nr:amidohydrolase family protein [Thermoanaerobaculia bacterium]
MLSPAAGRSRMVGAAAAAALAALALALGAPGLRAGQGITGSPPPNPEPAGTAPRGSAAASARPFVIRGVRVFDGKGTIAAADVLVADGKIAAVAPRGGGGKELAAPAGAETIDGRGKTLLPGLIDAHTHVWGDALKTALAFGVTTELDMFSSATMGAAIKADQAAGRRLDQADLRSAGTLATAPGGHGTEYGFPIPTLSKPEEAQAWVDARLAEGSDYIKIIYDDGKPYGLAFPTLSKETMAAVVAAAHQRGKLAVVHIGALAGARDAIEVGADGLAHLFTDREPDPELGRFAAAHHAFVVPTLTVLESSSGKPSGASLLADSRLAPFIGPGDADNLGTAFPRRPDAPARHYEAAEAAVRQLKAAGVPILAGTDAPNPGTAHGASIHRELELLVAAGLTPAEALTAATAAPAAAFRLPDRGRIAPGLRADLLLVEGDPTRDILSTRAIAHVWKLGVAADRDTFRTKVAADQAVRTAFGPGWSVTTDQIMNGTSAATLAVAPAPGAGAASTASAASAARVAGSQGGPGGAPAGSVLAVSGTVAPGSPFPWAGASYSPGPLPFAPTDLAAKKAIHFWAQGDGRTYQIMVFAKSHGMMPLIQTFAAGPEWKEYVLPFASFAGFDGHDLQAVAFTAGAPPGVFAFRLAGVSFQ